MSKYLFFAAAIFILDAVLKLFGLDLGRKFVGDSHHTTVDYFHQIYIGLFFYAFGLLIQRTGKTENKKKDEASKENNEKGSI